MKTGSAVLFFGVFFTVYGLVNFYVGLRGWQALAATPQLRPGYLAAFLFVSLAFIAGRLLERVWVSPLSEGLVWTGAYWLAAMLYFILALVLLDLLRLVNHFLPFFPAAITSRYDDVKLWIAVGGSVLVFLVILAGHFNALFPRTHNIEVRLSKPLEGGRPFHIAAASDIHLGTIIGRKRFDRIVERINALEPDLILLPGDIVDEDLASVIRENLGESLRRLKARYGVVAITGNHEYIGGADQAVRYLREHGVTVLRDSIIRLENGLTIVGREDRSIRQFAGRERMPLAELMKGVDTTAPVILLDHQPFRLEEGAAAGVVLQLSGHTHHGQLWPFNYITERIYEVSWGLKQIGETTVYVSSGVGTWGPPVRLGNRPEIVNITLQTQ